MTAKDRPYPPPDVNGRRPQVATIENTTFYRFYSRGEEPIYFDQSMNGRLNSPDASFRVLYAAEQREGAFAETFLRSPGRTLLPRDLISKKGLVRLRSIRALRLASLYGPGLAVLGATAEVTASAPPYDLSQTWAVALHNHPGMFDGIAYRARHDDNEICYAFFDRSASGIAEVDRDETLDADWFYHLLNHYSVGLAP
jgi:hypothetical protein